jgi:two-component system, sensor histidine kinase
MPLTEFFSERVLTEIREQMAGALALTDQLARQRLTPDGEACVAGVADAASGVRRLIDAVGDLREVARTGVVLTMTPTPLRELMDELEARWGARARMAGVTLLVSYDGDPDACAMTDRRRLLQLFDGLVGEAVAAQSRGAVEVGLTVTLDDDGVRLAGRVRGPRDPAWDEQDLLARIAEIEARLGLEVALGSVLARRVLDGMGGTLSRQADAGASDTTTFSLRLEHTAEADIAPASDGGRVAHILVVDDNATNRMVAQSLVEMFDCTSEAAEDGDEAVEAARSGRFDLILMDIKMPRMDGVSATRAIRALPGPVGRTPIIALTANADPEDAAGYLAAGMNGVVEKPMKPEQLLAALQEALDGPQDEISAEAAAA